MFYLLFWFAAFWLLIGTVGYPVILWLWAKAKAIPVKKAEIQPTISVVLTCQNDEKYIGSKISNLLNLDYPADKLEIIIVADGATDRTETIIELLLPHPKLKYMAFPEPRGRAVALNAGVAAATGDILVFTEARHLLNVPALQKIAQNFADEQVGGVCGMVLPYGTNLPAGGKKISEKLALRAWLRHFENRLKVGESLIHSVAGAYTALYAIRRLLYEPLPASAILDDLFLPFTITKKGYRVLLEKEATATELTKGNKKSDVTRRQHSFLGKFQFAFEMPGLFSLQQNPIFWPFLLHKTIRLFFPLLFFVVFFSNLFIAGTAFYHFTLLAQLLFYGLCLLGLVFRKPAFFYLFSRYNIVVLQTFYLYMLSRWARKKENQI